MSGRGGLQAEDCWERGGRLRVEVDPDGRRVRLGGNERGLVGLARLLLYVVQNPLPDGESLDLAALDAFAPEAVTLEISAP